jgi:heavy metal sensor kinase
MYLGLRRYLDWNLQKTLTEQARSIGMELLPGLPVKGPKWLASETVEAYAPETNGYFIRISRSDGSIVYASGAPKDSSFDPSRISLPRGSVSPTHSRNIQLPDGHRVLIEGMVFTSSDGSKFLVESGVSYQRVEEVLHGLLLAVAIFAPFILMLAVAAGYWMMRQSLRPVDEITKRARMITANNLSGRLPSVKTGDEIERLSTSLNEMIARLDGAFQHIARFTADASHELRTPLTILQLELEGIVQHHQLASELVDQIESALEEVHRLSGIVENLLIISDLDVRTMPIEKTRLNLGELVASTAEPMKLLAEEKSISLNCTTRPDIYVEGDRSHLKQLLLNLLDNAIKYTSAGGQVSISVDSRKGFPVVEVADTGIGIPAESVSHVFDRFYRADKGRSRGSGGVGLGLAIVKAICSVHGAEIHIESTENIGSRFVVEFTGCPIANEVLAS